MELDLEGIELRLSIGEYQITGGFSVKCVLDEKDTGWARIFMTEELSAFLKDKNINDCVLEMGSDDGGYERQLQGVGALSGEAADILFIRSDAPGLQQVRIAATFIDCSIQEAARYILAVSGIEKYVLTDINAGQKKVFALDAMSCEEALQELNTVYGTNIRFYSDDGIFYYGVDIPQEDYYTITDNNVLEMEKDGDVWVAEIIPIPYIHVRQRINLSCTAYSGVGMITKIVLEGGANGIDMRIRFREITE